MNRNVLVTGSSRGIGAAIAIAFAKEGDNVGINYYSDEEGALETAEEIRKLGVKVNIYKADVRSRVDVEKMFEAFFNDFQTIDVLVNNAGGGLKIPEGEFDDMPLDYWDSMIALNLSAAAYCSHHAIKNMKANNIKGSIINISSIHSAVTYVRRKAFPYCAAKGGLNMFTKTLAVEVARYGIHVNAVAPGLIVTPVVKRYTPEEMEGFVRKIPAGVLGTVDDITPMVLFLADPKKSGFIVGQTIFIDGGQSIDGTIDRMLDQKL
jgi:NAD(P)-dependent dehydrogenase (short-subunit alcohol dehydrogenase family)